MPSFRRPLRLAALTLALALGAAQVQAAGPTERVARPGTQVQVTAPLQVLASLWGRLTSIWEENGCQLDPFGVNRCAPSSPPGDSTVAETGCQIDSSGVTTCSPAGPENQSK